MADVCSCFSCSRYRSWGRIDFLKKKKRSRMEVWASKLGFLKKNKKRSTESAMMSTMSLSSQVSDISIDQLPDDVLIHIFQYISPNNINNFLTLIGLEMVSKRLRQLMVNKANKNIWAKVTELVLGFHPSLPDTEYLCHIGLFTLVPFLRKVPKITKVIVNIGNNWLCLEMMEKHICSVIHSSADHLKFSEIDIRPSEELFIYTHTSEFGYKGRRLIIALLKCAKQSLETCQFTANRTEHLDQLTINYQIDKHVFTECSSLKNLKISIGDIDSRGYSFLRSFEHLKSLQSLEISGLPQVYVGRLTACLQEALVCQLQTLRLTNPQIKSTHEERPFFFFSTFRLVSTMLLKNNFQSIHEFELHYCPHSYDLHDLPDLSENAQYLDHLKLTFHPSFDFNNATKVAELIENTQVMNEEMKISVTFLHSDVDEGAKLAIVHHLLIRFEVPIVVEPEGNVWEFIRGKVGVNLKLEKMQYPSLICHPHSPEN